jgi:hypothetical protein
MLENHTSAGRASILGSAPVVDASNKRAYFRHAMRSVSFPIRRPDRTVATIMLKDLSCSGACGLVCEPLQAEDFLVIEFDGRHRIEAKVRWVRRLLVGLEFTNPLSDVYLDQLRERCLERAAAEREALSGD